MKKCEPLPRAYEPAEVEKSWFPVWENSGCFRGKAKSRKTPYSIVIPPPNVTGILTLGHVLNNTLQDILCRHARMQGKEVCWFPGTDHAGIATEARVVKYLKESENVTRDELGREEFIRRVWQWTEEFGGKIIRQERYSGSMSRSFYVGDTLTVDEIHGKYEGGVLTLNIPKKEEEKKVEHPNRIMIE